MLKALDTYFPAHFKWSKPEGGMFIWVQGPQGYDMEAIYRQAIDRQVAFVPGKYFYTQSGQGIETMRLNYTMRSSQDITSAIRRLAQIITADPRPAFEAESRQDIMFG
jgi:2-aminoadipate transaminase